MIFGMSTACFFPKLNCEEAVKQISSMGINQVEVFFSTLSEYEKEFISELKSIADDCGAYIHSVHPLSLQFEPELFSKHERSRRDALCIFEKVLSAGAQLGSKVYVMHGPAHVKRACALNLNYEYIAERTLPLCELAQNYGIKLSWENVHWCWYAQPEFPERLEEHIGKDKLFYTLDVKQAAQSGYEPSDYIEYTKGSLINIHMCDYISTQDKGIVPVLPFRGDMNMLALKESLSESSFDGAVMLEVYIDNYKSLSELKNTYDEVRAILT